MRFLRSALLLPTFSAALFASACSGDPIDSDEARQVEGGSVDFAPSYAIKLTSIMSGTAAGVKETMEATYFGILTTKDEAGQSAKLQFQICDATLPKLRKLGKDFWPEIVNMDALRKASMNYSFDAALRDRGNGKFGLDIGQAVGGDIKPLAMKFATDPDKDFDGDGKPGLTVDMKILWIKIFLGFSYKMEFDADFRGSALVLDVSNDKNYTMESHFHASNSFLATKEAYEANKQTDTTYRTQFVAIPQTSAISCGSVAWKSTNIFTSSPAFSAATPVTIVKPTPAVVVAPIPVTPPATTPTVEEPAPVPSAANDGAGANTAPVNEDDGSGNIGNNGHSGD